jgi:lipoprotein signal peptidase
LVRFINYGLSFGLEVTWLVPVLGVSLLSLIIWWMRQDNDWSWLPILTGGSINLADRIITGGGVEDYWLIPGTEIYNNLADWLIFVGVVLTLIKLFKKNGNNI